MGSAPSSARRRLWSTVKLLLVVAVLVAAGTALYPVWKGAQPKQSDLTVRYRSNTPTVTPVAEPWFEVINSSKHAIPLDQVTLHYYFSADGAGYGFNCVEAPMGCSNVQGRVVALSTPADKADHYLEISFTSAAGTLGPGENSKGLRLQFYRTDHKDLNQADDHSFDASDTSFKPSSSVTAYVNGKLAWGDEPSGIASADAQPSASPSPHLAVGPGVMFDDFHYSGPKDPALFDHGWLIRTSSGGPGVRNTWTGKGISFPATPGALGGQALQLQAATDGTKSGTSQAELQTIATTFTTGTYAARIYYSDQPDSGTNGDHINESFYTISSYNSKYSELDTEYMPNGGWGAAGPILDTTSWYSAVNGDRATRRNHEGLSGWHTVVITAADGVVTYSLDGQKLFSSGGKYFPREGMEVNFNTWFVDLPLLGSRTWDMKVNWFYYNANAAMSTAAVENTVNGYANSGADYVDTMAKH
ncbi:cellulose binding domain-containing protein [Streptacidiphilus sp. MAP5-3]|uniref:cellulose binding domain-containing protein n=1 Tax=unclassified Streptacidiphilus TaxID=2643834 RepID=UPI003516BAC6